MLTPREKSPLPENFPRGGSNPQGCGQRAQTLPTSYSGLSNWYDSTRKNPTAQAHKTSLQPTPLHNQQSKLLVPSCHCDLEATQNDKRLLSLITTSIKPMKCLIGLVVKASASRAEDPGFESCWRRDFSRSSHTSDLNIGTPCQMPGITETVLGLVSPLSVYCDWVR